MYDWCLGLSKYSAQNDGAVVYSKGQTEKSPFCFLTCCQIRWSSVQQQPVKSFGWNTFVTNIMQHHHQKIPSINLDVSNSSPCGTPKLPLPWVWSALVAGWTRRGQCLSAQCWKCKSSPIRIGFENTFIALVSFELLFLAWNDNIEGKENFNEALLWSIHTHRYLTQWSHRKKRSTSWNVKYLYTYGMWATPRAQSREVPAAV